MKLELIGHDHRYAVEQMALMLLGRPLTEIEDGVIRVTLDPEAAVAHAFVTLDGKTCEGTVSVRELGIDVPADRRALEQRLVKLAAYAALSGHTGNPPWGALSGVRPAKLTAKWLAQGASPQEVLQTLTGLYGLRPDKAGLALRCAQESRLVDASLAPGDISLYLGVPFCPTRCAYCSFISADLRGTLPLVEPYVDALVREIEWAGQLVKVRAHRVRSVYMGGGTPTTLTPEQLDRVLGALTRWLDPASLEEFTVEAGRPDTITAEKLDVLRRRGVTRISVNPQTLSDAVLQAIGRRHTADDFRAAYALARQYPFAVNTDLIAGLPADTPEGFRATLDELLALAPDEITLHTLSRKHGAGLQAEGAPLSDIPDAGAVAQMLDYAAARLPQAGYRPYYLYRQKYMTGGLENVGWTRRDSGSFYNVVMMEELHSVLALGAGGVTKLVDRTSGAIRRLPNPKYPKEYLERLTDNMELRNQARL